MRGVGQIGKQAVRYVQALLDDINVKNTGVLAAGAAYYAVLSFFPMVAAAVAIAGLLISPDQIDTVASQLSHYLPRDIAVLVTTQMELAIKQRSGSLIVAVVAALLALFWASGFVENISRALNGVYGVRETRHVVRIKGASLALTVIGLLMVYALVALLMLDQAMLTALGVALPVANVVVMVRWLGVVGLMLLAVVGLYQFGPNHQRRPRMLGAATLTATGLWLIATGLFVLYARYVAQFSASYSLFAGVIALMLWCNLSSMALLIGAHVDALGRKKSNNS